MREHTHKITVFVFPQVLLSGEDVDKGASSAHEVNSKGAHAKRKWMYVSDENTKEAREEDVLNSSAYLTFYRRIY